MKVFICSPLRGDFEENKRRAKMFCRYVALNGGYPVAPHVYFTEFLDEYSEEERRLGIELGKKELLVCSVVYVFKPNYESCSSGMREEIDLANLVGIPVRYFTDKETKRILEFAEKNHKPTV